MGPGRNGARCGHGATVHAMGQGHGQSAYASAYTQGRPEIFIWFPFSACTQGRPELFFFVFYLVAFFFGWSGDEQVVGTLLSAFQDVAFKVHVDAALPYIGTRTSAEPCARDGAYADFKPRVFGLWY